MIAKAPVYPFHTHTHAHSLHGLTPTPQVASITALLKPAATAAAGTALKPTIGLRNSWFSFFSLWLSCFFFSSFHRLQTGNLLSKSYPIRLSPPHYASMVTGSKEGDCWTKSVIFKLTEKHPTWTQTKPVSHSNSSYHFLFSFPSLLFLKAFAQPASLPISVGPVAGVEICAR